MIRIYNQQEIEILRRGGEILAKIMEELKKEVKPGLTTKYLNKVAKDLVISYGAEPSFEGFQNYPATLCTSINEEIVHVLPSDRELKEGDILSLDLGIRFRGYCTDMAVTLAVGKISKEARRLIRITKKALDIGIKQARAGNYLGDIGWAIQEYAERNSFNMV